MDIYICQPPPVYYLDAVDSFAQLSLPEKKYLYACCQASWIGGLIDLIQTSPESAGIFLLIDKVFRAQKPDDLKAELIKNGFVEEDIDAAYAYFAAVYGNLGNYLSFGDTKFIPSISLEKMHQLLSNSLAFKDPKSDASELFTELAPQIYSLNQRRLRLDFGPTMGVSTYYSSNCTRSEAEMIQAYLKNSNLEAYNTRLFKIESSDKKQLFSLKFASSHEKIVTVGSNAVLPESVTLQLEYGDYSNLMRLLVKSIEGAKSSALNDNQSRMWQLYSESFKSGDIVKHKEASTVWVNDKEPPIETYIGFIESYRDPLGVRGEFEAFVAIVNRNQSKKFQRLVDNAPNLLLHLPWYPSYELDVFRKPDFTSLDVVNFACTGIPIGINIPNYDDIREKEGFKNVSLGNVIAARLQDPKVDFIKEDDKAIYVSNAGIALEIQVGLHELLGHGSGKLFRRNDDGSFNFEVDRVRDLLSEGPITKWYEPGENWDNKFSSHSSAMEECRAESVGIYLCDVPEVLELFGLNPENHDTHGVHDVVFINWLSMIRSGVTAMEFYSTPDKPGETGAWRQAHCCARYVILRVLEEADSSLVSIKIVTGLDGAPDLCISLDRSKIKSVGKPAIKEFLKTLQYYKSTGNAGDGVPFFTKYSELKAEHLEVRQIVINRKRPRPLLVQPVLRQTDTAVDLVSYPATYEGLIQSFTDRFAEFPLGLEALQALHITWNKDKPYHKDIPI